MAVFPAAVTGATTLTSGWKVELGIGDSGAIADVGVYDSSIYPEVPPVAPFRFPGTAGSYISTPDVNILDADTAHSVQAPWANQYQAPNIQLVAEPSSVFGASVAQWQSSGAGQIRPRSNSFAISASTQYTIAYRVRQVTGANPAFRMHLEEYDSGGTRIGLPFYTSDTDLSDGEWHWTYVTHTFDAAAVTLRMYSSFNSVTSGDVYQLDVASLALGAVVPDDTSFIPSLRIVGDIDLRTKAAASTWVAATHSYLISTIDRTAFTGYTLFMLNTGKFLYSWGDGAANPSVDWIPSPALADGTAYEFKVTRDASSGASEWWLDGTNVESDTSAPSAIGKDAGDLIVGRHPTDSAFYFIGDMYYAEVRDGIDGPIVARFDPGDYLGPYGPVPDGTTWQGQTGRTWTAHGDLESIEPDPGPFYGSDDPFGYLVDITSRVEGLMTRRGRESFTSRFRTGVASVTVENTDGPFTPPSGSGPPGILPLRPGRAVRITNNDADVFSGFVDSFTGTQDADGMVRTKIMCVDLMGQFTRNNRPAVTDIGAGELTFARMTRLLDRHLNNYVFSPRGTDVNTMQATTMAQDLLSELAITADSEGGGVWVGKHGDVVASGRDYFSDKAASGVVDWSVGGASGIGILSYRDEWAAIRIINEAHMSRADGTEQISTNPDSISQFQRRTHTRLDLHNDNDTDVGFLAERLVQFAGVDRLRLKELTFLPEPGTATESMAIRAQFGDTVLATITTLFGVEWTAPTQLFSIAHQVNHEVWTVSFITDDTLFSGEFFAFDQQAFDSEAFS